LHFHNQDCIMRGLAPFWLDPRDESYRFPDVSLALTEPDGLLAIGGSLSPGRLAAAYRQGIFPWYNEDQPILWWSPNPRTVLFPERINISRSLRKTLRQGRFEICFDRTFTEVLEACRQPRRHEAGTWITEEMRAAYCEMHRLGHAHSIECWQHGRLVGGLYGLAFGKAFFGESMFSRVRDASKVVLVYLARQLQAWGYELIDCQVASPHLFSMGAEEIPRDVFVQTLQRLTAQAGHPCPWEITITPEQASQRLPAHEL
jgi:leucyl/phenylalanyl-tRNA--protein transferase